MIGTIVIMCWLCRADLRCLLPLQGRLTGALGYNKYSGTDASINDNCLSYAFVGHFQGSKRLQ